jgi:hypothetical protein
MEVRMNDPQRMQTALAGDNYLERSKTTIVSG